MNRMSSEVMIKKLEEIFPNKPISRIQYIMHIVNEENADDEDDYKFERAFNLLVGREEDEVVEQFDEAIGGQISHSNKNTSVWLENLIQIFPDCRLDYLNEIIKKHQPNFNFDDMVDYLSLSV